MRKNHLLLSVKKVIICQAILGKVKAILGKVTSHLKRQFSHMCEYFSPLKQVFSHGFKQFSHAYRWFSHAFGVFSLTFVPFSRGRVYKMSGISGFSVYKLTFCQRIEQKKRGSLLTTPVKLTNTKN